jgi:hypothetical protein
VLQDSHEPGRYVPGALEACQLSHVRAGRGGGGAGYAACEVQGLSKRGFVAALQDILEAIAALLESGYARPAATRCSPGPE